MLRYESIFPHPSKGRISFLVYILSGFLVYILSGFLLTVSTNSNFFLSCTSYKRHKGILD